MGIDIAQFAEMLINSPRYSMCGKTIDSQLKMTELSIN